MESVFNINRILKKITNISNEKMFSYPICSILFAMSLIPLNVSNIKFIEDTLYKIMIIGLVFGISFFIMILANVKYKIKKGNLK